MNTQKNGRRSVAWQLAAGAAGLSMALGSTVLLPGLAAAAEDENWAAPVINDVTSCDSQVFFNFKPVAAADGVEPTYWVNIASGPTPGGDTNQPPVDEKPVEEAPVEKPVEEAPVEKPVEEAPVEEAPVEEAPVEEAPVEEAPVEKPVEEAPVEKPVEEAPANDPNTIPGSENPSAALAGAAAGEVTDGWTRLENITPFEGDLVAGVGPLTVGHTYTFLIEARAGDVNSLDSVQQIELVLADDCKTTEEPDPTNPDPTNPDPTNPDPTNPTDPDPTPVDPTDPVTEPKPETPDTPQTPDEPQPKPEVPVDVPVTPVQDPGGTPQVPAAPIVPSSVPSTPLKLTTEQGTDTKLVVGEKVVVMGDGFMPFSTATVIIYSKPQVLATVVTDANGSFRVEVAVPAGLPAGTHSLVASGVAPDGTERFLRLDVTVDAAGNVAGKPASSGGGLAYTGATPLVPALLGGATLVGGGLLVVVSRRRKAAADN